MHKPKDRRAAIAALIGQEGETSVEALAHRFDVSVETIRRDLARLDDSGLVRKVHGGARPAQLLTEESYQQRMAEGRAAKSLIAQKLANEIQPHDTLFIDTGTTTVAAAAALARTPGLTVVTNSLDVAEAFERPGGGARVYLLGGVFAPGNRQTVGPMAIEQANQFQADHAVLTVAALDPEGGAMDADAAEAQLARAMLRRAQHVIVLATRTKLRQRAAYRVCELDEIDLLITDAPLDDKLAHACVHAGVEVR